MWIRAACSACRLPRPSTVVHRAAVLSANLTPPSATLPFSTHVNEHQQAAQTPTKPASLLVDQQQPPPAASPAAAASDGAPAVNAYTTRTHTCGELRLAHVGQTVTLCGWLQFQRMRMFLTLRDGYGETQIIIPDALIDAVRIETIPFESILCVRGRVIPRPAAQQNGRMATGDVELQLDSLHVLNRAVASLPMEVRTHNRAGEQTRLEHRYLDLRFADMQRNLRLRSRLLARMRDFLVERAAFVEVETPTLFRRTPGGAQEFVVPTRRPGQFYSLVQSPQQFKQMLMAGAVDRYFQVARCYRYIWNWGCLSTELPLTVLFPAYKTVTRAPGPIVSPNLRSSTSNCPSPIATASCS